MDGTPYDAELFIMPVFNAEGDRTNFVSIHRDISQRKQAEAALRSHQDLLQAIYDAEPECVKLLNADGTLTMMNAAGLKMIEAESLDEVQGKSVYGLIAPEDREAFESLTQRVFRGEAGTLEFETVGRKGHRRTLETHAVPLRNSSGEIMSLLVITRDVSERKEGEQALREREERLRAVLNTAVDAIITIDRGGIIVSPTLCTARPRTSTGLMPSRSRSATVAPDLQRSIETKSLMHSSPASPREPVWAWRSSNASSMLTVAASPSGQTAIRGLR
jgi:PAS domain S-box-containing protein